MSSFSQHFGSVHTEVNISGLLHVPERYLLVQK